MPEWSELLQHWPLVISVLLFPVAIVALKSAGYNIASAHAEYQRKAWDHLIDELNKRNEEERRHQHRYRR